MSKFKKSDVFIVSSCIAILFFFLIFTLIPSTNNIVEEENRTPASLPSPTLKSITSGSFFERFSAFVSDNFPLRQRLIEANAIYKLALGQIEVNGVFSVDGRLIARGEYNDLSIAKQNFSAISSLSKEHKNSTIAIIPRPCDVYSDILPKSYDSSRADELKFLISSALPKAESLHTALLSTLKSSKSSFFKTDHHWTSEGAYLAYRELCSSLGIEPYKKSFFDIQTVTDSFYGTLSSKSSLRFLSPDSIELYRYTGDTNYIIENRDTSNITNTFYELSALEQKDKYKVFLGGNFSSLGIKDIKNTSKPRLLLIKDSYANSLIPFLALHYDIDVIDPRYIAEPIREFVDFDSYDQVMLLFSSDTLATTPIYSKMR